MVCAFRPLDAHVHALLAGAFQGSPCRGIDLRRGDTVRFAVRLARGSPARLNGIRDSSTGVCSTCASTRRVCGNRLHEPSRLELLRYWSNASHERGALGVSRPEYDSLLETRRYVVPAVLGGPLSHVQRDCALGRPFHAGRLTHGYGSAWGYRTRGCNGDALQARARIHCSRDERWYARGCLLVIRLICRLDITTEISQWCRCSST